jgi:hypothetical protein
MAKKTKIQQNRLDEVENEFGPLLLACLGECARGRWGLFGQNDHVDPDGRWLKWPEADRLKELAREIKSLRIEIGGRNENCERFVDICSLRGANVPGEPKLAAALLAEIGQKA